MLPAAGQLGVGDDLIPARERAEQRVGRDEPAQRQVPRARRRAPSVGDVAAPPATSTAAAGRAASPVANSAASPAAGGRSSPMSTVGRAARVRALVLGGHAAPPPAVRAARPRRSAGRLSGSGAGRARLRLRRKRLTTRQQAAGGVLGHGGRAGVASAPCRGSRSARRGRSRGGAGSGRTPTPTPRRARRGRASTRSAVGRATLGVAASRSVAGRATLARPRRPHGANAACRRGAAGSAATMPSRARSTARRRVDAWPSGAAIGSRRAATSRGRSRVDLDEEPGGQHGRCRRRRRR